MNDPLLQMQQISKRFGSTQVLENVSITVEPGEVHALLGENGAGKSTLLKILFGTHAPDGGQVKWRGQTQRFRGSSDALRAGIAMIHQELALVPEMSIAQNIWLGREGPGVSIRRGELEKRSLPALEAVGLHLAPSTPVRLLSTAQQQLVEIARAISSNASLIVMDEPTSSLASAEIEHLYGIVRQLKAKGVSVIYVSHHLNELEALADRANILEMCGTHFFNFDVKGMIHFDRFALLFNSIIFFSVLIYFLLSAKDMEKVGVNYAEYFVLIFFILCGVTMVSSYQSLLILFLGIEIISIPLYILTGSDKRNLKSNEAALKYFLMGAFSTGLMLMGIALIYGARGSFELDKINILEAKPSALLIAGMILLLFSMSFKVSAAPFHFWTPDVYDGAPTVFTSFMATIVKAAAFVAFIRLFDGAFGFLQNTWQLWMAIITAATLFIGNITAVFQQSVKRMLAYSSIAQAGFMMLSVFAMNTDAKEGLLLYAAAYCLATIGIFSVLVKMNDYTFDGFNGMAKKNPLVAGSLVVFILSLAGIPLTAGFISKFYMLKAALATGKHFWLVVFAVLMAAVSVYYYFRVLQAMYFKEGDAVKLETSKSFNYTLLALAALIILLGIFPNLLLYWFYF